MGGGSAVWMTLLPCHICTATLLPTGCLLPPALPIHCHADHRHALLPQQHSDPNGAPGQGELARLAHLHCCALHLATAL